MNCNAPILVHTYIASILHTFYTIFIVLPKVCAYHEILVRGLHVQYNKLEEKSVINFEVRDLNNKENMIGQNGSILVDKVA